LSKFIGTEKQTMHRNLCMPLSTPLLIKGLSTGINEENYDVVVMIGSSNREANNVGFFINFWVFGDFW
jgi:hypothetical protein